MFKRKFYNPKQRKLYGWGWFVIFFIAGGALQELDWSILSYILFLFAGLSLYTAYFGTNDTSPPYEGEFTSEDFDNPKDYADNIIRLLKDMKNSLFKIKKNKKGKLNKKDILSYVATLKPSYNDLFGDPKKEGNSISFKISPELEPFQVQIFFLQLPEFAIEIYSVAKYEGFHAGIESNEKKIKVNIESDFFPQKPNNLAKKLNKILLKYPNVVDDALIEKPWKVKIK